MTLPRPQRPLLPELRLPAGPELRRRRAKLALTASRRAGLYRKLGGLARVGLPLPRALDALWRLAARGGDQPDRPLAVAIAAWRQKVYDGHSFGVALADWVPASEWMIVEAGAANLGRSLEDAAGLIDSSRRMVGAVVAAAAYPLFLGLLLCILMWIFGTQAVPAFAAVKPMDQWTGMAAGLGLLSEAVQIGLLPLLTVLAGTAGLALWSLPRWTGEWRRRFDRFPPWSFYRLVVGAGFMTALVAFLRAGMPIPEALRRIRSSADPWLRERIDACLFFLNSGHDLGEALHLAGHAFPDGEIVEDLRIYAMLGNLDELLQRITQEWLTQSLDRLRATGDALKVGGMIVVAGSIGWIQLGIIAIQHQLASGY